MTKAYSIDVHILAGARGIQAECLRRWRDHKDALSGVPGYRVAWYLWGLGSGLCGARNSVFAAAIAGEADHCVFLDDDVTWSFQPEELQGDADIIAGELARRGPGPSSLITREVDGIVSCWSMGAWAISRPNLATVCREANGYPCRESPIMAELPNGKTQRVWWGDDQWCSFFCIEKALLRAEVSAVQPVHWFPSSHPSQPRETMREWIAL